MKKFLFIFCVLATVAGVLPSCDDEIDETPSNGKSENVEVNKKKLLASTTYKSHDGDLVIKNYEYDENGKTINVYSPNDKYFNIFNIFNFVDTASTESYRQNFSRSTSFNLDGSIERIIDISNYISEDTNSYVSTTSSNYTYDENKHLVSVNSYNMETGEKELNQSREWIWENGNITKFVEPRKKNGEYCHLEWLFEYTNDEVITPLENKTDFLFYGLGGYLTCINRYGVAGKDLPVIMINGSTGNKYRIDWSLDKDGYPTKMEYCWADENGKHYYDKNNNKDIVATMDFVWE